MLNCAIVAAFLATSAAAFDISPASASGQVCETVGSAAERVERPAARPLGTVDSPAPAEERNERPRTVRA